MHGSQLEQKDSQATGGRRKSIVGSYKKKIIDCQIVSSFFCAFCFVVFFVFIFSLFYNFHFYLFFFFSLIVHLVLSPFLFFNFFYIKTKISFLFTRNGNYILFFSIDCFIFELCFNNQLALDWYCT